MPYKKCDRGYCGGLAGIGSLCLLCSIKIRAKLREAEAERDRYKTALESMAADGCGHYMDRDCRAVHPGDPDAWCWSCQAMQAIEGENRDRPCS